MLRAVLVATLLSAASPALAVGRHAAGAIVADTLTALPAAGLPAGKPLRAVRSLGYGVANAPAAWRKFAAAAGGTWSVSWDQATAVPTRIWGSGILAPGAMASADLAELIARTWLANHIALLAPGATAADFALVSNVNDGNIRAVGFVQTSGGLAVVGGQIGFEFQHDRLFVIGSTALPDVRARLATAHTSRVRATPAVLRTRGAAVRDQLGLPASAAIITPNDQQILPLVGDDAVLGYNVVDPLKIDGGAAGAYLAYLDPASGRAIAVVQTNLYATGTLDYVGVDRYPGRGRVDQPAPLAHVAVDGTPVTSGHDGSIALPDAASHAIATAVIGDLVAVHNEGATATPATTTLPLAAGGTARWDASATVEDDAQVIAYLAINTVKDFVRANVDANMPSLDDVITANVNVDQSCNAFFDGTNVNFFRASTRCENTGRINDVMFHEFGHSLHAHEIIPGVGFFDGAMSEGAADTLAVNITQDSGLGRGFFYTDTPLRELNPPDQEAMFPRDIGEIHTTGLIFGGTWWDLRTALRDALGADEGEALTLKLYVGALRRSVDIPSSLVETLATDDDDGDLSNGTPHECIIRTAYAAHGMHTVSGAIRGPALVPHAAFPEASTQVRAEISGLVDRCGTDNVDNVTVTWTAGSTGVPTADSVFATRATEGEYFTQLPLPIDGASSYHATVNFTGGSVFVLPDNRADPAYQVYQADTVQLYCTDFETDPLAAGWTLGAGSGATTPFVWTVPPGGGRTDPPVAFSGTHVLMQSPGSDYAPSSYASVSMPTIDVGHYSDVRLQYRRWLAVEDSHFDQARILANGNAAWENATANLGDSSTLDHIDKEWRFHDVPLSGTFTGSKLTVTWDLTADTGLELGGWAIDDVCVVANPESVCGDGMLAPSEQCDSGSANADAPDACRADCEKPRCGDGIIDSDEQCDPGSGSDPTCLVTCQLNVVASDGCSTGGSGGLLLVLLVLGARRASRER